MKFVIQRVSQAAVTIEQQVVGQIGRGLLVLVGIQENDTEATADKMLQKMVKLRIFEDENGKTNLALGDVGGALLLVSQFTLCASCKKGNRPSFLGAGDPRRASALYHYMVEQCRAWGLPVETGRFGAEMKVSLVNDGPFTIVLDSDEL